MVSFPKVYSTFYIIYPRICILRKPWWWIWLLECAREDKKRDFHHQITDDHGRLCAISIGNPVFGPLKYIIKKILNILFLCFYLNPFQMIFFCKFYEAYFAFFIISFSITRKSWLDRLVDWECFKEAIHHFIQEMTSTKRSKNDIETKRFFLVNWNINVFLIYKKILVFAILKKRYLSYPYVFIFTAYSWLNVIYLWSKYR